MFLCCPSMFFSLAFAQVVDELADVGGVGGEVEGEQVGVGEARVR